MCVCVLPFDLRAYKILLFRYMGYGGGGVIGTKFKIEICFGWSNFEMEEDFLKWMGQFVV